MKLNIYKFIEKFVKDSVQDFDFGCRPIPTVYMHVTPLEGEWMGSRRRVKSYIGTEKQLLCAN